MQNIIKKNFLGSFIPVTILLFISGCSQSPINGPLNVGDGFKNGSLIEGQFIVILKDNFTNSIQDADGMRSEVISIMNTYGIPQSSLIWIYDRAVKGFASKLTPSQVDKLWADKRVQYIEQDKIITLNDPQIDNQNSKNNPSYTMTQTVPWGITRVGGAVNSTTIKRMAWIVDTGIDLTHPDLTVFTPRCKTFVRTGPDVLDANDMNGHGTHCAGIIAAKDNTIGVVGVAAGAAVVAVKVLNLYGSGNISDIVAGLNYVAQYANSGDVVNMSFGGGASITLDNAVKGVGDRGLYVTIAAGNSADYANYYSPSRMNGNTIFTVSACDNNDYFAYFSNYGNPPIDWCAPGVSIYSTYKNGGYATMSGTSMSAPHLAGILLANNGVVYSRGKVKGDPDGVPDKLASRK